jgi:hypothetical protein
LRNAIAYYGAELVTAAESFMVHARHFNPKNIIFSWQKKTKNKLVANVKNKVINSKNSFTDSKL